MLSAFLLFIGIEQYRTLRGKRSTENLLGVSPLLIHITLTSITYITSVILCLTEISLVWASVTLAKDFELVMILQVANAGK